MSNALDSASLIMVPSGYENGTLGSVKPTDGTGDFTFSRGSDISATRVNEDGYIEKGYENLLTYSNDFSQSDWIKFNASVTSGQSGYDGSSDAWLLNITTSQNSSLFRSISMSGVYTTSVYAKANSVDYLGLRDYSLSGAGNWFNLSNGTIASTTSDCIDAKIESVGNGWYRCSITQNRTTTGYTQIGASDNPSTTSTTSGSIYIQDAMLNQGMVSYPYVETTTAPVAGGILEDMPRLDYTDSSCPSLKLEPQRTNLAEKSEYIGGWSFPTNVTLTQNYGISPEGLTNSTRLQFTSNGFMNDALSQVSGTQYTLSIYAKRNDGGTQSFGFYVDGTPTIVGGITLTSDWQRFTYTYTASNSFSIGLAGNSGADVSVYGFQLEQDATYPTSYIPTYGVSQTRVDEEAQNNIATTGARTYFIDGKRLDDANSANSSGFFYTNSGLQITYWSNNRLRFRFGSSINQYNTLSGSDFKVAVVFNGISTNKIFVNGSLSSSVEHTLSDNPGIDLRSEESSEINQTLFFPTALSDDECIALTTI